MFAILSLSKSFPEYVKSPIKNESPDWIDRSNGIGIEVTRAEKDVSETGKRNQNKYGTIKFIGNTYLGKVIPSELKKQIKELGGDYTETNGLLVDYSDTRGMFDSERNIRFALSMAEEKLKLLNYGAFESFRLNCLYIYLLGSDFDSVSLFAEQYKLLAENYPHSFSIVFLMTPDTLIKIDTLDSKIKKCAFGRKQLASLQDVTHQLSKESAWKNGTAFFDVLK